MPHYASCGFMCTHLTFCLHHRGGRSSCRVVRFIKATQRLSVTPRKAWRNFWPFCCFELSGSSSRHEIAYSRYMKDGTPILRENIENIYRCSTSWRNTLRHGGSVLIFRAHSSLNKDVQTVIINLVKNSKYTLPTFIITYKFICHLY